MKTGDRVLITCQGRTVEGVIILASENGISLVLDFDALLDGHVGAMPVLQQDDGSYCALLTGTPIEIRRQQ